MEVLIIYNKDDVTSSDIEIESEKNYITLYSIGADREFPVKIHERFLLPCSVTAEPEKLKHIDWYRCSPNLKKDGCVKDGKMVLIAQVKKMEDKNAEPNFDVYTNGTLVIIKALPTDDGMMFKCSAFVKSIGRKKFTAILNIAKGDVYISVI